MGVQIPKAKQLFTGDINRAVIAVQQKTGFEITKKWWDQNVGNGGSTESILERFDRAYERDFAQKIAEKQAGK